MRSKAARRRGLVLVADVGDEVADRCARFIETAPRRVRPVGVAVEQDERGAAFGKHVGVVLGEPVAAVDEALISQAESLCRAAAPDC